MVYKKCWLSGSKALNLLNQSTFTVLMAVEGYGVWTDILDTTVPQFCLWLYLGYKSTLVRLHVEVTS